MLRIGHITLGEAPRIAVPVTDAISDDAIAELRRLPVDIIELRIDRFADHSVAHVAKQLARYDGFARLATIRARAEGGDWPGGEEERLALFEAIVESVDAVDIELSAETIVGETIKAAHQAGKLAIGSYHNFDETPVRGTLDDIALDGMARGVDIVKVAAMPHGDDDLRRLAAFTIAYAKENIITVAMGEAGAISRVLFPALGSLITYAAFEHASAPGQLPLADQLALMKRFYPSLGIV